MGRIVTPSQSLSDRPARISRDAARELARAALRVQQQPYSTDRGMRGDRGPIGQWYAPVFPGVVPAVVTTEITACSTSGTPVPGAGAARLWGWDDEAEAAYQMADVGMWGETDGIVDVRNWYTASGIVVVGTHIIVSPFGNAWWLVGGDC